MAVGRGAIPGPAARALRAKALRVGLAASLILHLAMAAILIALPVGRSLRRVSTEAIDVEIVGPQRPAAERRLPPEPRLPSQPRLPAEPPPLEVEPAPVTPPPPAAPAMVTPTRMLSAQVLDEPQNRQAKVALAGLEEEEGLIQLCSVEGMEQIAVWDDAYKPELLVAYAMSDTRYEGDVISADGAAFYSDGAWYNLQFECTLTAGGKVASFAFLVGDPIPRSQWEAHYLSSRGAGPE